MQAYYHQKLATWQVVHPSPAPPSSAHKGQLGDFGSPLKPVIGQFHRLATVALMTMVAASALIWLAMRVIYPQPHPHVEDFSGYEALMPGETANPEDYSFKLIIPHVFRPEEMSLDKAQNNTYINTSNTWEVSVIDIPYQQRQISRLTIFSHSLRLHDLLWRWGRPDFMQKNSLSQHWDFVWHENQYNVATVCSVPNINSSVKSVWITMN